LADVGEQLGRCLDVVGLAGGDDDLHRQAIGIGQSMDFRSKTTPASSKTSIRVAFLKWQPRDGRARWCRRSCARRHRKRL